MELATINNACLSLPRKSRAAGNVWLFVGAANGAINKLLYCFLLMALCLGSASSDANTPPPGQLVASFVYNPSGLRIEKQGERGVERFTYDEQSLLQAYDENNTTLAKYDYGAERLVSLTSSSEPVQFYLTDALNSVVNLTNTAGSVQARYQYDAFGNQRAQSGSSYNRFAFTGYVEDKETDLLYAKARYYDSDTGRFLSQDAWEGQNDLPPSLHKYLYAYQNPTVYVDPDGNIVLPVLAAYFLYTSIQTAVDVGVDRGIAGLTNDDNFSYTKSIATNFAINAATAGVGGKIKNAGKAVQFGVETAIDAGLTTAYEVGIEGKEAGSTLLENTASGVVGRVVGDKVARQLSGSKVTVDGGSTPSPRQAQSKSEATVIRESDASPAIRQEESARVGGVGVTNSNIQTLGKNPKFFTSEVTWKSPQNGTGYEYKVYQQEIDWGLSVDGKTNLQRVVQGNAPYVMKNGVPERLNLHHSRQNGQGPLFELTEPLHLYTKSGYGREALHPFGRQQHPEFPVNRPLFTIDKNQYWIDRIPENLR